MPRPARAAKVKAGVNIAAASGSTDADGIDDYADEVGGEVDEPPAKRAKGKGKGNATVRNTTKRPTWEPIEKPPLCKEWKDIPDWKGREDSPLMGLPVEVLDKIFCVRPELNPRDYLALAGTCTFFRNHMTDDFWEDVCHAEMQASNLASNSERYRSLWARKTPNAQARAGTVPFSRSIEEWRISPPKSVLNKLTYPVVSNARRSSKWSPKGRLENDSHLEPYRSGHYVPAGPRSEWSLAQYRVYKEEQAAWRINRTENRLKGLEKLREDITDDPTGDKAKCRRMGGRYIQIDLDQDGKTVVLEPFEIASIPGIEYQRSSDADERGDYAGPESVSPCVSTGIMFVPGSETQVEPSALLATSTATNPVGSSGKLDEADTEAVDRWEAPESEASEAEDEFEWLWQRGAKFLHDHWPSTWRTRASQLVNGIFVTKDMAMKWYRIDEWELSTLKSYKQEVSTYRHPRVVGAAYRRYSVEARAYQFRGGHLAHETYVSALVEREEAKKVISRDKIRASIAAGTRKHNRKRRPYTVEFSCCSDDESMCYCKSCWDGQCECGEQGKDPKRFELLHGKV